MDAAQIDKILLNRLILDASAAIEAVGLELEPLLDQWTEAGVNDSGVRWLNGLLERLGWWSGRLEAAADCEAAAQFPSIDR